MHKRLVHSIALDVCMNYCVLLQLWIVTFPLLQSVLFPVLLSIAGSHDSLVPCCSPWSDWWSPQLLQHTSGWVQGICGGSGGSDVGSQGWKWASEDCGVSYILVCTRLSPSVCLIIHAVLINLLLIYYCSCFQPASSLQSGVVHDLRWTSNTLYCVEFFSQSVYTYV